MLTPYQIISEMTTPHNGATLIADGTIGSRQGWREAPYLPCPARMDESKCTVKPNAVADAGLVMELES